MPKALVATVAAAAMLAGATPWSDASAMMLAAPSLPGVGAMPQPTRVAVICGPGGCAPVHVSRAYRPPPNFVRRAAPLVFTRPNPLTSPPANK
ncbi:MAG: hypothetical protein WBF58_09255 [Xanthobacteraceae bacterium]